MFMQQTSPLIKYMCSKGKAISKECFVLTIDNFEIAKGKGIDAK